MTERIGQASAACNDARFTWAGVVRRPIGPEERDSGSRRHAGADVYGNVSTLIAGDGWSLHRQV